MRVLPEVSIVNPSPTNSKFFVDCFSDSFPIERVDQDFVGEETDMKFIVLIDHYSTSSSWHCDTISLSVIVVL